MTPLEIIETCRNSYNALNDNFYSESELLRQIELAQQELVHEGLIYEGSFEGSTIIGTQDYDYPTSLIAIKRVEYDGKKLQHISFRQDDQVTLYDSKTSLTGEPQFYMTWNNTIKLRPIPSAVATLKVMGYRNPDSVESTSVLDVPALFHPAIVCYVTKYMAAKDQNWPYYDRMKMEFDMFWKPQIRQWVPESKVTDSYNIVNNEDLGGVSIVGVL